MIAFDVPLEGGAPSATRLRAGAQVMVGGQAWSVASVSAAKLIAAQGELPYPPNLQRFVRRVFERGRAQVSAGLPDFFSVSTGGSP